MLATFSTYIWLSVLYINIQGKISKLALHIKGVSSKGTLGIRLNVHTATSKKKKNKKILAKENWKTVMKHVNIIYIKLQNTGKKGGNINL